MTTRSPAFASIPESIQWSPPLRETSCVRRSFPPGAPSWAFDGDRKSTRLNSSHDQISYAVFCLKKKKKREQFRFEQKMIEMNKSEKHIAYDVSYLKHRKSEQSKLAVTTTGMLNTTDGEWTSVVL